MQERRPRPEVQYGMDVRKYQQVLMQFHQFDTDGVSRTMAGTHHPLQTPPALFQTPPTNVSS